MKVALYTATRPGIPGLYNRLVRLVDGSRFSHAELVFDDGVCWSSSYMDGGVRRKLIELDPAKWHVIELPANADANRARDWFERHEGAGYDLGGNLRFVWRWWPQSRSRWFCTEAIAAALGLPTPEDYGPRRLADDVVQLLAAQRGGGKAEE